jgi:hypothetical protein
MTEVVWYDCRLSISARLAICLAKDGINDSVDWLRDCVRYALPVGGLDDCYLPVTWEWEIKDGEEFLNLDLKCFDFDFSHDESENVSTALRKSMWRIKQNLASACFHAKVTISGSRADCPRETMAFFETTWDRSHRVVNEKIWDAETREYVEITDQVDLPERMILPPGCECCGKGYESGGYFAKVHYQGRRDTWTRTLCEDCCILENSCRCDGCKDEFTESFPMERIDGDWYCEKCSEYVKSEKAGAETIIHVAT